MSWVIAPLAIILCFKDKKKGAFKVLSIIVVLMLNVVVGIIWLCIEGISLEDDHERLERREARRKDKKQRAKEWIIKEREQEKEWYPKIRD